MGFIKVYEAIKGQGFWRVLLALFVVISISSAPTLIEIFKESKTALKPSLSHTVKYTRFTVYFYSEREINALRAFMLRYYPIQLSGLTEVAAKQMLSTILITQPQVIDDLNGINELCHSSIGDFYIQNFDRDQFLGLVYGVILNKPQKDFKNRSEIDQKIEQKIEIIKSIMSSYQSQASKKLETQLRSHKSCSK